MTDRDRRKRLAKAAAAGKLAEAVADELDRLEAALDRSDAKQREGGFVFDGVRYIRHQ